MNKLFFERLLAFLLIAIPGALGVLGWKWMKDAVYNAFGQQPFSWGRFFMHLLTDWHLYVGGIFFLIAIFFIGGFIFFRDAKQNRIQPRFKRNK